MYSSSPNSIDPAPADSSSLAPSPAFVRSLPVDADSICIALGLERMQPFHAIVAAAAPHLGIQLPNTLAAQLSTIVDILFGNDRPRSLGPILDSLRRDFALPHDATIQHILAVTAPAISNL